jgi:imidazolonepropionase-like amidohydrolase
MLIVNANLIDCTGGEPQRGVFVDITDRKIRKIGTGPVDPARVSHDVEGRWVMPGLINAHDHLTLKSLLVTEEKRKAYYSIYRQPAEGQLLQSARGALTSLGRGITSVRDAGAAWFSTLRLSQSVRHGVLPAARMFTCGKVLSAAHEGEGVKEAGMTTDVSGADQVRERVRELVDSGVHFIKMKGHRHDFGHLARTKLFSLEEIQAASSETRKLGRKFALHAWHTEILDMGLTNGLADSIEHGIPLYERPDLAKRMAADGVIYVPCLTSWCPSSRRHQHEVSNAGIELRHVWDSVEVAIKAGVPIAAGTDLHTDQLHDELQGLVEAGLSVDEALQAATINAARLLGLEGVLGTIEPGKAADLIVLDGDPREKLSRLSSPYAVVTRGQWLQGEQLRALESVPVQEDL